MEKINSVIGLTAPAKREAAPAKREAAPSTVKLISCEVDERAHVRCSYLIIRGRGITVAASEAAIGVPSDAAILIGASSEAAL